MVKKTPPKKKRQYTFRNRKAAATMHIVSQHEAKNRTKAEAEAQAAIELAQFKQSIYKDPIILQFFDYINGAKDLPDHLLLTGAVQFGKEVKTSAISVGALRVLMSLLREKLS